MPSFMPHRWTASRMEGSTLLSKEFSRVLTAGASFLYSAPS